MHDKGPAAEEEEEESDVYTNYAECLDRRSLSLCAIVLGCDDGGLQVNYDFPIYMIGQR